MSTKTVLISELFDFEEAEEIVAMRGPDFHAKAVAFLTPLMPRINAVLEQENDVGFMAYVLEYQLNQLAAGTSQPRHPSNNTIH